MSTQSNIRFCNAFGWGPSLGYLVTIVGGVVLGGSAFGCDDRTSDGHVTSPAGEQKLEPAQQAGEPVVVNTPQSAVSLPAAATIEATAASPVVAPAVSPAVSPPARLEVKRFTVTSGIDAREPTTIGTTLPMGGPIFAFTELASGPGAPATVEVVFQHEDGRKVGFAKLEIPADQPRWRTWGTSRHVNKLGAWTAVLLDGEGVELARAPFEIAGSSDSVGADTAASPDTAAPEASAPGLAAPKSVAAAVPQR